MKKILKKSLACMLAAILCLTACVGAMASVGAEGAITYAIADVAIDQGAEGVIDVTVSNFADVAGLIAEITLPDAVVSIDGVKLNDSAELVEMTDETAGHYVVNGKTVKFVGLFNSLNEFGDALANVDTLEINIAVTVADEASVTAFAAPVFMAGNFNEEILDVTGTVGNLTVNAVCKHTETKTVEENRVEADCVNDGSYDEVVYCAACDYEISRTKKTIAALGHTEGEVVIENQVEADCDTNGSYDEVVYCTVCNEELSRETKTVDALGHEGAEAVIENRVEADCVNAGSYDTVVYCTVCNEEISRVTTTVDALGHTEVIDAAVAPTCTETGLTEGKHCSVCGEVLVAQEVVPVIDHNYVDGKCDVCGADDPNYEPPVEGPVVDPELVFAGSGASVSFGQSSLEMQFRIRNTVLTKYARTELVIVPQKYDLATKNLIESPAEIVIPYEQLSGTGTFRTYDYKDMMLYELALGIDYELRAYDANDILVAKSETYTQSVVSYLKSLLNGGTTNPQLITVATDMLVVCEEARIAMAKAGTDLERDSKVSVLDGVDLSLATPTVGEYKTVNSFDREVDGWGLTSADQYYITPSVSMEKVPVLSIRLRDRQLCDDNKLVMKFSYTSVGSAGYVEKEITGAELNRSGNFVSATFSDVGLHDSNADITVEFIYDGVTTGTLTYSIETYLGANQSNATIGRLATALIKLGSSFRTLKGY